MVATRNQEMAQRAFAAVKRRVADPAYASFAKPFPALIQAAGLCQAVAFARVKRPAVLEDLVATIGAEQTIDAFAEHCREADVVTYVRLSRTALQAASWLKRYVESLAVVSAPSGPPADGSAPSNNAGGPVEATQ